MDNLLNDDVDKYNQEKTRGSAALVDPSEELVMVANTFVSWYKLFRREISPKFLRDVRTLTTQADRLWGMLSTVFPYKNKMEQLIMDTEKVHSLKHCGVEIANYANPINTTWQAATDQREGTSYG
jgi:hypothetical protein